MMTKQNIKTMCVMAMLWLVTWPLWAGQRFAVGDGTFLLDGRPFVVKAAELHYPRIPRPYWEHRLEMCRALGMNTVCLYVFWNVHEPVEGRFDFTGNNDVAAFCRLAQRLGLYVIVRPGPYVCAEWEMGGLPWWLLKDRDIRLRENDPRFVERVRRFEREVGRQLAPLTIDRGGPIIMVQVENEYGSYGIDKPYVSAIRDIVRKSGFDDVVLFQCDWASNFEHNGLDDLVWTMNFGTGADIDAQFARLKALRPHTPLMCSEYWSGWFDKWGAAHETRPAREMVDGISQMLSRGISFSLYMTHGGTSFGHWAGANSPGYAPDVTSYDYDAPVSECGLPTAKYWLLRDTMRRYASAPLPAVPSPPAEFIEVAPFALDRYAPLECGVTRTVTARDVMTFEDLDMGWGTVLYSTRLPALAGGARLTVDEVHDFAAVLVNGRRVGTLNRMSNEHSLLLPPVAAGDTLTLVVEGMGRINFGRAVNDRKGITRAVTVDDTAGRRTVLRDWTMRLLPDDVGVAREALSRGGEASAPGTAAGYYRGTFTLERTGDTFLLTDRLGKGQAYVNGHDVGRYWHIGPQQALYVPACWLTEGENEFIAVDVTGPVDRPVVSGSAVPVLDRLRVDRTLPHRDVSRRPLPSALSPVADVELPVSGAWRQVTFTRPARGRLLVLEVTAVDGGVPALAEVRARDASGGRPAREAWTAHYADSEQPVGNHTLDKVFDLQESTYWQADTPGVTQMLVIDLGAECEVAGLDVLPWAGPRSGDGGLRLRVAVCQP